MAAAASTSLTVLGRYLVSVTDAGSPWLQRRLHQGTLALRKNYSNVISTHNTVSHTNAGNDGSMTNHNQPPTPHHQSHWSPWMRSTRSTLAETAPAYPLSSAGAVEILEEPSEFYDRLLELATGAQRAVISSLYLGTGSQERALVACLADGARTGCLKDTLILLDNTRGTRGAPNSVEMLSPLLKAAAATSTNGVMAHAHFYHTPDLRGWQRQLMRPPFNEVVGLTHTKIYIFDDTLVLSGANLSADYFDKRQDRYYVIHDAAVADFYEGLVRTFADFSFCFQPSSADMVPPTGSRHHPLVGDCDAFKCDFRNALQKFTKTALHSQQQKKRQRNVVEVEESDDVQTWLYPLVQAGPYSVRQEQHVMEQLLRSVPMGAQAHLASGYFNMTREYIDAVLSAQGRYSILSASPSANGFLGAAGIRGHIPAAYTHLEHAFFVETLVSEQAARIKLAEYERKDWTFHAKGLWVTEEEPHEEKTIAATAAAATNSCAAALPSLTAIGSSNFNYRSQERDLEAQAIICTRDPQLRKAMASERDRIFDRGVPVTEATFASEERRVALWEMLATKFVRSFF
eukprot:UC1_evm5s1194